MRTEVGDREARTALFGSQCRMGRMEGRPLSGLRRFGVRAKSSSLQPLHSLDSKGL